MDLWKACQTGNLERIKEIVNEAENNLEILSRPDADGIPSLHWAALNGRWLVCKYLLDHGVAVDVLGGDQSAPAIHWAICKGHSSVVALLIRFGADWRLCDLQGYNSMHVAAQNGQEMILLLLKAQGADINTSDKAGRSPLMWAAYRGHAPAVQFLIQNGADLNQQDEAGRTPFHWSIIKGQAVCSAKMAKAGAAFDLRDVEGKLPGDWAKEKEVTWFDKLQKITLEFRRSRSRPRGRTLELIGTVVVPCMITPTLILTYSTIPTWWWSCTAASVASFILYNLSAQICIPPEKALPETSFLAYYNYSTLAILIATAFTVLIPNQITRHPVLSILCVGFSVTAAAALYKLKSADPGKLALPRADSEKDETVCQLASDGLLDKRHFCVTCSIKKPLRSKHCKTCDRCVGKFDHHCPWINNCVGFHNHRSFMVYLYSCIGVSLTFLPLAWNYFHQNVDQSIPRSPSCFLLSDQLCRASSEAPVLFWVSCFGAFMTLWMAMLTVTQTYQILRNLTTNEMTNYSRLEYFYPQLSPEDEPFDDNMTNKSKRFVNVFDMGMIANWSDFWKHPLQQRHNFNFMEKFSDEDLRHARIKKLKVKRGKGHSRSESETSIPLIANLINSFSPKPKNSCCTGSGPHHQHIKNTKHRDSNNNISSPHLQSNASKEPLLEGQSMV